MRTDLRGILILAAPAIGVAFVVSSVLRIVYDAFWGAWRRLMDEDWLVASP